MVDLQQKSSDYRFKRHVVPLVVIGIALISSAISFSWYTLRRIQLFYEPRLSELTELRYAWTSTYLISEKIIAGDTTANQLELAQFLAIADSLRRHSDSALLNRGIKSIPAFYNDLSSTLTCYDSIKVILIKRHTNAVPLKPIDYKLNQTYDSLFSAFRGHLFIAEQKLQQIIINRFQWFLIIQLFLFLSCVSVATALGYLYYHFARRHKQDLDSLANAHHELDVAYKEKVESEQQLKATNQQLRANEQQLRAANQQLKAHEQQLRAVNQQLRASEQQLRATNQQLKANEQVLRIYKKSIDHAEDLISAINTRYEFVFINGAFERYYGVSQGSIAGKTVSAVMGKAEFSATAKDFIDRAFRGERSQYEIRHTFAGPGLRTMQVSYYPLSGDEGTDPIVIQVLRDISDRKKTEEERQKVQRLETVGQLAAGIAHDFNNILGGIFGFISLAKMSAPHQGEVAQYLEGALSAYTQAKNLTQQLLTFSRGGLPVKKHMHVDPLIKEAASLSLSGSAVRPILRLSDNLSPVEIDEGQIHQMLGNLIINARQAMPKGGEVIISAKNLTVKEREIPELPAGAYVQISIIDSGIGIAPEHLPHIFEPFFTTKQEGSGLGLSICFSIIKKHGGHITVESELGKGSAFTLFLPAATGDIHVSEKRQRLSAGGTGSILVMDDNEHVLFVTEHLLSRAGYSVTAVKKGDEAINSFQSALDSGRKYDAVVLDLTIPGGMGGLETFIRLRKLDPHVRGIVTSGYSNDPIMADFKKYGFTAAIKKPCYPEEILEAVSAALSKKEKIS
jgi:PAS domain S-box-containing protein